MPGCTFLTELSLNDNITSIGEEIMLYFEDVNERIFDWIIATNAVILCYIIMQNYY